MERGRGLDPVHAGVRSADITVAGPDGRGRLLEVARLPGAGKSPALEELQARGAASGLLVLDSAAVRAWLQPRLMRIPYPVLRPVVHSSRLVLRVLARCGVRPVWLVWIDVPDVVAPRGRADRRRVIRPRAFLRRLRRVAIIAAATTNARSGAAGAIR
jgi:hypothetical protein